MFDGSMKPFVIRPSASFALAGRVEPRGAKRPAADPDGGAPALLRAAPPQVVLLGRRVRVRRLGRRRRVLLAAVHV